MKAQLFGLLLLALAIVFTLAVLFIFWLAGNKQQHKDYEKLYERIVDSIEHEPVTGFNRDKIIDMFYEISKYSCKNYEKLQVLEENFYKKYKK